ncbi:MAG: HAD family hydrolase [Halomonadaceae bacterium]|nr:MAG: HAD family hydrolase [Halomonadaceae bacterium]
MKYQAVIFDWDGTLVDSVDHIATCLQLAAAELNYPPRTLEQCRHIVGLGMVEALNLLYPGIQEAEMLALRKAYGVHFFARETLPENVFSGAHGMLDGLLSVGQRLAVATGKSRPGLDKGLHTSGLGPYFELTRCADETASKPDPTMLRQILAAWDLPPEQVIMVGDTSFDLEMAHRIGMPAVGVTWGGHQRDSLQAWQPIAVVDEMQQLSRVLAGLSHSA